MGTQVNPDCFVIMPIQNEETEFLWEEVYKSTIEETGFRAIRIDEEEDGRSMHAQIVEYLKFSPLIVADITLSRPNCYWEVGFAMGQNKYSNLILCCREDHNPDSNAYNPETNKVHFDVNTYYVIWWTQAKLADFKQELKRKILQRKPKILQKTELENPRGTARIDNKSKAINEVIKKGNKELETWKRQT